MARFRNAENQRENRGGKQNRKFVATKRDGENRHNCDADCQRVFQGGRAEFPQRVRDNRDNDRAQSAQWALQLRQVAKANIKRRQNCHQNRGGQNEGDSGANQTFPAAAPMADVHRHFSRIRPGNQIRRADHIDELSLRKPLPLIDELALHQRDVRQRPAKSRRAQSQKQKEKFAQRIEFYS